MSDARTRQLLRDAEHGDLEAEVRALQARLRDSDLPEERLRLAAYLGHEASRHALAQPPEPAAAIQGWIRELDQHDDGVLAGVRCAICAAQVLLPLWDVVRPNDDRPALIVRAAANWALDPSPELAHASRVSLTSRTDGVEELVLAFRLVASVAAFADSALWGSDRRALFLAASTVSLAAQLASETRVRRAIGRHVGAWALGADPLPRHLAAGLWPARPLEED